MVGEQTPMEAAEMYAALLEDALGVECASEESVPTPFWDNPDATDADDSEPAETQDWYFELGHWILTGFLALTVTPAAAIAYQTTIKPIVVKLQTGSAGAIAEMFIDGELVEAIDTFTEQPNFIQWAYNIPPASPLVAPLLAEPHELIIRHSGTQNANAVASPDGFSIGIIRDYLGQDANGAPVGRIDPDTGDFQNTIDGGETWFDNPVGDPRNMITLPPLTGSDIVCRAASSIVATIEAQFDEYLALLATGASVLSAANLLIRLLVPYFFAVPLVGLYYLLGQAVVSIGANTIIAALTPAVWDKLRCIFITLLSPDGRMSAANMPRLYQAIYAEYGVVPEQILDLYFDGIGYGGLSNMASLDAGAGFDCMCSECPIAYLDDMQTGIGWRTTILPQSPNGPAVWTDGAGRTGGGATVSQFDASAAYQQRLRIDVGQDCFIQQVNVWRYKPNATISFVALIVRVYTEAGVLAYNETATSGNQTGAGWTFYSRSIGLATGRYVEIILQGGAAGGAQRLDDIQVHTG